MPQRKDVLFIIDSLRGGGAERALIELLRQFDYTRYRVTLYVIHPDGVYLKDIPREVEVATFFSPESPYKGSALMHRALRHYRKYNRKGLLRYAVRRTVKRRKYDAIVSFVEGIPLIFHTMVAGWGKRNITWLHCDLRNFHHTLVHHRDASCEKACYEQMDDIVFVSQNAMDSFGELYGVPARKHCIYNVVDVDKIREAAQKTPVGHSLLTVTTIGSLSPVKGYDRLLRVAKRLKNDGYALNIQLLGDGDSPVKQELFALQESLGLQDYVHFLGFQDSPFPWLKESDIFVSTSLSEGLPYVICESLALGVPVVATRTAGAMELLGEDQYGLLADQSDDSVYHALKRMIDDEKLREHYRRQSLERARLFDVKHTMEAVYRLL